MNRKSLIRSSVEKMTGYVPGEQPANLDVVKLNTNENPFPPSPSVMEALQSITADSLRRYPPPMAVSLRACIADLYEVDTSSVFCGNGSDEVLALCTRAFVEKDKKIGYFEPSYSLYPVLSAISDRHVIEVELDDAFGWVDPPLDANIDLFFLTNPNAPTGLAFPMEKVVSFCERFDGVVLIDEAYADFASCNCLDVARRLPNVIVSRSLSKSYSLAGLRVGFAIGHPLLIEALDKIKDSYNLDIVAQKLAIAALQDQGYVQKCLQDIRNTRSRVSQELASRGFSVYPSETNFLWCKPPHGIDAECYVASLRSFGILVRHFSKGRLGSFVRISIGLDQEMDQLLEKTDTILEEKNG